MDDARHSGFTLIELLVTLALAGLLAGLAIPAMGHLVDAGRLRGASQSLVQELREARNRALLFHRDIHFSYSQTTGDGWCYGWSDAGDCSCAFDTVRAGACLVGGEPQPVLHRRASDDFPSVALQGPDTGQNRTLVFSAVRGTARAGSFVLHNRTGKIRVIVSPLGRVRSCSLAGSVAAPC
jgi:prepilin-type N-terminal cleavage/methylation domain-containing protein